MHLLIIVYISKFKNSNSNDTIKKKNKIRVQDRRFTYPRIVYSRQKCVHQSFGFFFFGPAFPQGNQESKKHHLFFPSSTMSLKVNFCPLTLTQTSIKVLSKQKTFSSLYNLSKIYIKFGLNFAIFLQEKANEYFYFFKNSHLSDSR